ncbi:unnamed protein product [Ectocarpus sp. CCAP 1310/34]|nr:unnamed protein product [Ectocarpus sp. CCAP 1310/34]
MKSGELEDAALFGVKGRFRRKPHDDGGDPSTALEESLKKEPAPPAQKRKVVAMGITLLGMCYLVALSSRALSTIHHHHHHHQSSSSSSGSSSSSSSSREGHPSLLFGNGKHLRSVDHRRRARGGEDVIAPAADAAVAASGGGGGGRGGGAMDEPTAEAAPAPAGSGAGAADTRRAAGDLDRSGRGGGGVIGPRKSADGVGARAQAAGAVVGGGREAGGREGKDEGAPQVALPNQGQSEGAGTGDKGVSIDSGTRSEHFGGVQRGHQQWLMRRAAELRDEGPALPGSVWAHVGSIAKEVISRGGSWVPPPPAGIAGAGPLPTDGAAASVEERVHRMEEGVRLWGGTFVPPVEPTRRLELIDKWSGHAGRGRSKTSNSQEVSSFDYRSSDGGENSRGDDAGRILFVMTSFDRGRRLGPSFKKDKLDFILLMMDEMREACEAGFSPNVHLIAAWELSEVEVFVRDRLFCRRTGGHVPYSLEVHPSSIGNDLSIKHRIFMKPRLEEFDLFLQVEDDVIVTLNHMLLFREESELLDSRRHSDGATLANTAVPGFIRVEHAAGEEGTVVGPSSGEEWQEWEVMLSRRRSSLGEGIEEGIGSMNATRRMHHRRSLCFFSSTLNELFFLDSLGMNGVFTRLHPVKLEEAGIYLTLGPSLPGMWMATREQLRKLSETMSCDYLNFDESSKGHVETHSGSLQMFKPNCGRFQSFLVHHRANNKHGVRGESVPGVPITLLRCWVEQFIRDEKFLKPFRNPSKDSRRV